MESTYCTCSALPSLGSDVLEAEFRVRVLDEFDSVILFCGEVSAEFYSGKINIENGEMTYFEL